MTKKKQKRQATATHQIVLERNKNKNSKTPLDYSHILNGMLIDIWSLTPFQASNSVPTQLLSHNEDGSVNVSYSIGNMAPDAIRLLSCFYQIKEDGVVYVQDTGEWLDLKSEQHLIAIIYTIIHDLYGDHDFQAVLQKLMDKIQSGR